MIDTPAPADPREPPAPAALPAIPRQVVPVAPPDPSPWAPATDAPPFGPDGLPPLAGDESSSRRRRLVAGIVAAVLLLAGGAVTVVGAAWPEPTPAAAPAADIPAAPTVLPRPPAGAPMSARQEWVAQEVTAMLAKQSTSLLAGDFAGFSSVATPGDTIAAKDLRQRFDNLRALQVTRFDQRIDGQPWLLSTGRGRWRVVDVADHCFVEKDCAADQAVFDTLWKETPEGLRFTGYQTHNRKEKCLRACFYDMKTMFVRPWETTDLAVRVGSRTLVAVPREYANRLPDLVRRADAAAALADRYAVGDGKVDRYRVFAADTTSWNVWYTGFPGRWVAGLAVPTGPNRVEVAASLTDLTPGYADTLLRHELAHVSTLRNDSYYGNDEVWWLVEGMAEYVGQQRTGTRAYENRPALRSYLNRHTLSTVAVTPPGRSASNLDAVARYAIGYYALTYLMKMYGKTKALQFFQQAVQYGLGLDTAARNAFGKPWRTLDKESTAAVRRS